MEYAHIRAPRRHRGAQKPKASMSSYTTSRTLSSVVVLASGVLMALAAGACSSSLSSASTSEESDLTELDPNASLSDAVASLGADVSSRSPGTILSIAVQNLVTGEHAEFDGDRQVISASSAKAIWVAAALDAKGIDPVTPYAGPIFRNSDNSASGKVIDLIGPAAENVFYQKAGMTKSGFKAWNFDKRRVASNAPDALGTGDNYFTANDVVTFLTALDQGKLLGDEEREQLLDWMLLSPRSSSEGAGGWLGTRLPAAARKQMHHKAGWLPPDCCSDRALNEIGIIEGPDDTRYAVAILAHGADDYWNRQVPMLERASCVIYRAVTRDPVDCGTTPVEPSCEMQPDGNLHCGNTPNVPMYYDTKFSAPVVDTLRSSDSWFNCWGLGEKHRGGNTTWYHTMGDDKGKWGWVPAINLKTTSDLDANPSAVGLPRCDATQKGR